MSRTCKSISVLVFAPFQFVSFSFPPLALAGVAFQLGSRVPSKRWSLNFSSFGCRGKEEKKKKRGEKKKKSLQKKKREFAIVQSLNPWRSSPCDTPSQHLPSVKFDALEPCLLGEGGLQGREQGGGAGMLSTKSLGRPELPPPRSKDKKQIKHYKNSKEGDERVRRFLQSLENYQLGFWQGLQTSPEARWKGGGCLFKQRGGNSKSLFRHQEQHQ